MFALSTVVYDLNLIGELVTTTAPPLVPLAVRLILVADSIVGVPTPEELNVFAVIEPVNRILPSTLLLGAIPPVDEILPLASMIMYWPAISRFAISLICVLYIALAIV